MRSKHERDSVVLKLQICLSVKEQLDGGDEAVLVRVLLRQQVQHRVQRCVPEGVQRVDFNAWCRQERSHRGDLHLLGRAVQRRFAGAGRGRSRRLLS